MRNITLFLILGAIAIAVPSTALSQTESTKPAAEKDVDNTRDPAAVLRDQIQAATHDPERNRLRLQLAELLLSTDHKTEAMAELNAIANSKSFDPVGFYNLGNAFARLGESDASIAAYRTAIEQRKGRYSRAYNNLGVMLMRAGRWDEAHDTLLMALQLENFRYAEASYNMGRLYYARGQHDLAIRELHRALKIDPNHDAASQALALAGTEGRIVVGPAPVRVANSAALTKTAPPIQPSASGAKLLTLDPISFDYLQKARTASERGKMNEAVEYFQKVLTHQGGYFAPANLELGYVFLSQKRYDEALNSLVEVTKRDGARYPVSYFHVGRIYEQKGDLKLAEAAFAQAADISTPPNGQFLLDLSRVREKLGDYKGSLDAMERYMKLVQDQGLKPAFSAEERIADLRTKAAKQ